MKALILILILLLASLASSETIIESPHQVWKVGERRWSVEEESNFARWVESNLTEDFFIRHKIPVDCADVPYAVRWIYARIAGLPAAATTKDNKLIGHWSTNWKHLPTHTEWHKDLRFRKALSHMLSETTTRTLPLDTYPIRVDQESVTPGTPFFVTESHAGIIGRVILDGSSAHPLQTWEATSPAKVQKLTDRDFLTPRPESTVYSGLAKFRWQIFKNGRWEYLPTIEHPFYSLEQYSSNFYEGSSDFVEAVARRIDPKDYDPLEKLEKVLDTTLRYLMVRVPVVQAGYERCRKGGCQEGSALWEIHSTPGRDGRIILLMDHLRQIIETNHLDREAVKKKMEAIFIPIHQGQSVTFYHLYQNHLWLSPHPGDSIEARWGLKKCEMIFSQIRTTQNAITFIERTYRKKDPKYADFTIGQQQEILRRLMEEWIKSDCKEPAFPKKKVGR
ncbi:MAG: hypothetical protein FJ115_05650 [Deltaproteobacteria bacterium]|nr:hypothetical protein [Deltaproteobacteria bacterium]MBM4348130.1 hypothetical protein [Deltaproteobacteria bacterium]